MIRISMTLCMLLSAMLMNAQTLQRAVPFSIPPLKPLQTKNLFVPENAPIAGFVTVKDGHFALPSGERLRLWGTTLYYTACFPDSATAIRLARQLRELGCNAVRFYGMDFHNWNEASFLKPGTNSNDLDEAQMKRFDWFIFQLKQQGIYALLHLHGVWQPRSGDGITRSDSMPSAGRIVNYFDKNFQKKLKDIWWKFFSHLNPYTKKTLADEPTIALATITTENSLFNYWINNYFHPRQGGILSYHHRQVLDSLFNKFLQKKYGNTAQVKKAWEVTSDNTTNLAMDPGFEDMYSFIWNTSVNGNSPVRFLFEHSDCEKRSGTTCAVMKVGVKGTSQTDARIYNSTGTIEKLRLYELRFWAKAQKNRTITSSAPGSGTFTAQLTTEWKEFVFTYRSSDNFVGNGRIYFNAGADDGNVFIDDVSLKSAPEIGLAANEKIENGTIIRSKWDDVVTRKRMEDNVEFYQTMQRTYYDEMYSYLRKDLNCKFLLTGGTLFVRFNDIHSMQGMDFTMEMEGWDFNRNSGTSWYIANTPQLSNTGGGTIPNFVRPAMKDKPNILGSYTMPFPSAHLNEMMTLIPNYASYQDMDAVFMTYYSGNRTIANLEREYVDDRSFNEQKSVPTITAMMPTAASVFRGQMISPAAKKITINQTKEALLYPQFFQRGSFWIENSADARMPLFRQVYVDSLEAKIQSSRPHTAIAELASTVDTRNLISDTEELLWNVDERLFTVNTDAYKSACGLLSGKIISIDDVRMERMDNGKYGAITWMAADKSQSLTTSPLSLLTVSTRSANGGAVWSGDTSTATAWGTGRTEIEAMTIRISFAGTGDSVYVFPLDSAGNRLVKQRIVATKLSNGKFSFEIDQQKTKTMWYHLEQKGKISGIDSDNSSSSLLITAPNPAKDIIHCVVSLPNNNAEALIVLIDQNGTEHILWRGIGNGAVEHLSLSTQNMASGMYTVQLRCGTVQEHQKTIIMK